jgi:hypothetical protein
MTFDEALERVKLMAKGDAQWDLSPNDREALSLLIDRATAYDGDDWSPTPEMRERVRERLKTLDPLNPLGGPL